MLRLAERRVALRCAAFKQIKRQIAEQRAGQAVGKWSKKAEHNWNEANREKCYRKRGESGESGERGGNVN